MQGKRLLPQPQPGLPERSGRLHYARRMTVSKHAHAASPTHRRAPVRAGLSPMSDVAR